VKSSPPSWVDPLMRVGYAARGVVYVVVGALVFLAALSGAPTPDSQSALGSLLGMPFGKALLGVLALGLIAYALWGFIDGGLDLDDKGTGLKGWAARGAKLISGALHLALAVSVAALALGRDEAARGSDRTDHWTAVLMQQPFGRWLVAIVGAIAIALGVQHFVKAYKEKYKDNVRYTSTTERLDAVLKVGLAAHGLVALLVGGFFVWAAWTAEPARAGGLREALEVVRNADSGQILLAIMALGLLAFAVYCFIQAAFRIVPRTAPQGLETLASRARALMSSSPSAMRR
jgi:hypothetical protein